MTLLLLLAIAFAPLIFMIALLRASSLPVPSEATQDVCSARSFYCDGCGEMISGEPAIMVEPLRSTPELLCDDCAQLFEHEV